MRNSRWNIASLFAKGCPRGGHHCLKSLITVLRSTVVTICMRWVSDDRERQTLCSKAPFSARYGVVKATSFVFTLFSWDPCKSTISTIPRRNRASSCQQNHDEINRFSVECCNKGRLKWLPDLANHKAPGKSKEPIKTQNNCMVLTRNVVWALLLLLTGWLLNRSVEMYKQIKCQVLSTHKLKPL